ncbi:choice-of-anchor F family protein [Alteraurantiacibacter aquimixticola]|uniref:Autotransporter outer membrane beta-barrel domain-containing protein n=1 Tax=Alteraurantiacibacter aquimixticola TaxID=2489173 RepID=A0A4T3F1H5_9SPHN|nr:choice-of-anchor F family protein [Alteraurantiacibacter aquimixticola]TIX51045.1 autotransporter outer membrane beta-barrel domain-containing protein [Alteraurantiacibacter aquimixticola]
MTSWKLASRASGVAMTVALALGSGGLAHAGEIIELESVLGDGFILIDPDENVVEPGGAPVTTDLNNDDFMSDNGFAPNGVANCLMASNGLACDAEPGSGKRIKHNLTGMGALDTVWAVEASGGTTEYFTFGKITNQTDLRMTGFRIEVGTGSGDNFVLASQSGEALSMDQVAELLGKAAEWEGNGGVDGQNPLQRAFFPDGLFGTGGQEGEEGYFTAPDRSGFYFVPEGSDTLVTDGIWGGYAVLFGNGVLSRNQVPEALFFDNDGDPSTEAELLYWKAGDLWLDGDGIVQDAAAVDALLARDDYYVDIIEDLSNANLNYSIDVGDIAGEQLTIRFVPVFAPIIMAAETDFQFDVAVSLDQTEIPYLFYDQSTATGSEVTINPIFADFQEVTGALNSLSSDAEIRQGLETAATSYLRNFGIQAQLASRDQLELVLRHVDDSRTSHDGRIAVFLSGSLSTGDIEQSANGAGSDFDGMALAAGADYRLAENLRLGAALGYGQNSADIDFDRGELEVDALTVMGYGSYGADTGFYVDLVGGHSWVDFDNDRDINIGSLSRHASSETDGRQWNFAAKAGYGVELGPVILGPSIQYHYYDLEVDGYAESGAGALSMTVDAMEFASETLWLGGQVELPIASGANSFEPRLSAHWVKEFEDEGAFVATAFTDGLLPFITPIDAVDDEYVRVGAGVTGHFQASSSMPIDVSINYDGTLANRDYDEHRVSLEATARF